MLPNNIGPVRRAWLTWKSLRLPWRKRFLVGFDLEGNTYWEFRLTTRGTREATANSLGEVERWRRIVEYPPSTHLSAVKVSPLWHQWLRYTRAEPPSLEEQQENVVRQIRMKKLAADADARWEAKPRVMEDPMPGQRRAQQLPSAAQQQQPPVEEYTLRAESRRRKNPQREQQPVDEGTIDPKDPWKQARNRGPSEDWQPQAWSPNVKK